MVNFISLDPSKAGTTGLIWLLVSYGYGLFVASNLIADGSELLLLIPSIAGLVGSVVLPLLGAVPDGAIMLFSGLGEIKEAQKKLNVGVGALAGSTIMLLTLPWAASIIAGRVDFVGPNRKPNYKKRPKLTARPFKESLTTTGVPLTEPVVTNGIIMLISTIPYYIIQIPAVFFKGSDKSIAGKEKYYALTGLIICSTGFIAYMYIQWKQSLKSQAHQHRIEAMKKMIDTGKMSLSTAMLSFVKESMTRSSNQIGSVSEPLNAVGLPPAVKGMLSEMCREAFLQYDIDGSGYLDKGEIAALLNDMNDNYDHQKLDHHFQEIDTSGDGKIDFDEFVRFMYLLITETVKRELTSGGSQGGADIESASASNNSLVSQSLVYESAHNFSNEKNNAGETGDDIDDDEGEEVPEKFEKLSPEEQQKKIKIEAAFMLLIGTAMVVVFSDPVVGVLDEVSKRIKINAFYVSFVLAPVASNASEIISSYYYAKKKTTKTITVSLTTLEGAATMNNTFCLSIFMALIFFRGLAWHFTSETISIVLVQIIMFGFTRKKDNTVLDAIFIASIFPLSIGFVAGLKKAGLD